MSVFLVGLSSSVTYSVVEGVTTDALIPLIQLSGIRKLWDPVGPDCFC